MGSSNLKMGKILTVVVLPAVVMFSTGFTYKAFETDVYSGVIENDVSKAEKTELLNNNSDKIRFVNMKLKANNDDIIKNYNKLVKSVNESSVASLTENKKKLADVIEKYEKFAEENKDNVENSETITTLNKTIKNSKPLTSDVERTASVNDRLIKNSKISKAISELERNKEAVQNSVDEKEQLEAARQAAINNTFNNNVINNYVNNNSESNSADSSAPSYNTYYVSSVYCGDYINAQGCVDSYSFTTVDYTSVGGPFWIGGHNHGPAGIINNFNVGDHVVVSGSGAGTYRITGFTYIPKGSGTDVRNFGGSIVFQTCTSTNMRVAYAERI